LNLILSILLLLCSLPDALVVAENNNPLLNPDIQVIEKGPVTEGGTKGEVITAPAFPGLSEVGPRASELKTKADESRKILLTLTQMESREQDLDTVEARFQKLQESILKLTDADNWDATKLSDANLALLKEKKDQEALVAKFTATLTDLESYRMEWEKQEAYWREWSDFLDAKNNETLSETFDGARKTITQMLKDVNGAIPGIFPLQERGARLLRQTIKLGEILEVAFSRERTKIFKKNEISLFNTLFYTQFNSAFWRSIRDHLGHFEDPPDRRSLWKMAARISMAFILAFLVLSLRETERAKEDRLFLLDHPWALGVFLSEALSIIFFGPPIGILRNLSSSFLAFSSLILLSASLNIRIQLRLLFFLAALVMVPGILKMIPLPSPLFRLYWVCTALAGTVLFLSWSRHMRRGGHPGGKKYAGFLMGGAVVMALAAVAQLAGFVSFSEKLLLLTLKFAFLVASINLLLQINRTTMLLLLEHSFVADIAFIRRFGKELGSKLRALLNFATWGMAFFFLLSITGVYSSAGEAFEKLFLSRIVIGKLSLSPALVLVAVLVLYLSSFISWIIRAILESEIFPRIQVDRGASQSVTKLLHYFLIFFGFLISMSVIGLELKSFAVLGGALGIGIGFGLQNIVNNFISGLVLLFERPVRVGDRIEADSQTGIVKKIGLRSTVIETLDQSLLIIPNSKLVSEKVTNWTHSGTVARMKIPVGVAYNSNVDLVLDVLIAAALASSRVLVHPKPIALLLGFGDSCLNMELHVWLADVNQIRLAQGEICREILRRFGEAGIEIPFPQQEVRLKYNEDAQFIDVNPGGSPSGLATTTKNSPCR